MHGCYLGEDALFPQFISSVFLLCRFGSRVCLHNQVMKEIVLVGDANQLAHTSEL